MLEGNLYNKSLDKNEILEFKQQSGANMASIENREFDPQMSIFQQPMSNRQRSSKLLDMEDSMKQSDNHKQQTPQNKNNRIED